MTPDLMLPVAATPASPLVSVASVLLLWGCAALTGLGIASLIAPARSASSDPCESLNRPLRLPWWSLPCAGWLAIGLLAHLLILAQPGAALAYLPPICAASGLMLWVQRGRLRLRIDGFCLPREVWARRLVLSAFALALVWWGMGLIAGLTPSRDFDSHTMNLALPRWYALKGGYAEVSQEFLLRQHWLHIWHVVQSLAWQLGGSSACGLMTGTCWLLGLVMSADIAARLSGRTSLAVLGALAAYVACEATFSGLFDGSTDTPGGPFLLAGAGMLMLARGKYARVYLVLAGCALAFAAGIKQPALIGALCIWLVWAGAGKGRWGVVLLALALTALPFVVWTAIMNAWGDALVLNSQVISNKQIGFAHTNALALLDALVSRAPHSAVLLFVLWAAKLLPVRQRTLVRMAGSGVLTLLVLSYVRGLVLPEKAFLYGRFVQCLTPLIAVALGLLLARVERRVARRLACGALVTLVLCLAVWTPFWVGPGEVFGLQRHVWIVIAALATMALCWLVLRRRLAVVALFTIALLLGHGAVHGIGFAGRVANRWPTPLDEATMRAHLMPRQGALFELACWAKAQLGPGDRLAINDERTLFWDVHVEILNPHSIASFAELRERVRDLRATHLLVVDSSMYPVLLDGQRAGSEFLPLTDPRWLAGGFKLVYRNTQSAGRGAIYQVTSRVPASKSPKSPWKSP